MVNQADLSGGVNARMAAALRVFRHPHRQRRPSIGRAAEHLSFFIHHGPETVAEMSDLETPARGLAPVAPRRGSSILRYVNTNYSPGSSIANLSSMRTGSSSGQESQELVGGQGLPDETQLSRHRSSDNHAFYPIDSIVTITPRSDISDSDVSDSLTSSQDPQPQDTMELTQPPTKSVVGEGQQLTRSVVFEGAANNIRHAPQPSVPAEVAAQIFQPQLVNVTHSQSRPSEHPQPINSQQEGPPTLSSSLSRWSAEFDQFADYDQIHARTQRLEGADSRMPHSVQHQGSSEYIEEVPQDIDGFILDA